MESEAVKVHHAQVNGVCDIERAAFPQIGQNLVVDILAVGLAMRRASQGDASAIGDGALTAITSHG